MRHHQWEPCVARDVCPGKSECSARGKCVGGECVCNAGYSGVECSIYVPAPAIAPVPSDVSHKDDVEALVALFENTLGLEWKRREGWKDTERSVCMWEGVECDSDERVVRLDLSQNNLDGPVPSLLKLRHLKHLNLSSNHLVGALPSELPRHLVTLDVSHNHITGEIPSHLLRSESLKALDITDNFIIGVDDTDIRRLRAVVFENNGCHRTHAECSKALFACESNCVPGSTLCTARPADCPQAQLLASPLSNSNTPATVSL